MPKFFVCTDVHSHLHLLLDELEKAGYDVNNPDHWIISCGDYFDRGPEPLATYDFFYNQPRTILVRGNHEDLLEQCIKRRSWEPHDVHNGTVGTVLALGQKNPKDIERFYGACCVAEPKVKALLDKTVNYFETEHYIFVHGWIPCYSDDLPYYFQRERQFEFNPDWRHCHASEWDTARWVNGMRAAHEYGILETGKTIICGHWHTSFGHANYHHWGSEFDEDAHFDPFVEEGIIALDACTAYSQQVNVAVIEDNFLKEET